ncbi:MAG: pyridoxamine 5'-phosphate oxidase family protein [Clostridia bacterium]|nr:pyridoxamine 5'-phosphate oxidase family protein [Clostridia bacterium]
MFRELTRINKKLSQSECVEILTREKRGVLSVLGDGDYPYGMPMNHFYDAEDGKIYFHCGRGGHRADAIAKHDKVSFCVYDEGSRIDGDWALHVKSVIVFGRIEVITDMEKLIDISTKLSHKFTDDEEYIRKEIEQHAARTVLLALTPEHLCGKAVTES